MLVKSMKRVAVLALALLLSAPVWASSGACYDQAERDAEQLVRLHSALMVITLSCRTDSHGVPLSSAYQQFTQGNLQRIKDAEHELMAWHRRHGAASGEAKMDRIRTEFHNEYSYKLAQLSPATFCANYRDMVMQDSGLTGSALTQTLRAMAADYRGKTPSCAVRQAAK